MTRQQSIRAARLVLMTARDAGGDKATLYRIWLYLSYEMDALRLDWVEVAR